MRKISKVEAKLEMTRIHLEDILKSKDLGIDRIGIREAVGSLSEIILLLEDIKSEELCNQNL